MSSKRGRKRNDNLPPNRARDVQRAFRARRAAHLQALECRVSELEDENNHLRAALSLPPANRAPLGKGPTGKDKPKGGESSSTPVTGTSGGNMISSRESSSADSPSSSTRNGSVSPASVQNSSSLPRAVPVIQNNNWEQQSLLMNDHSPEISAASTSSYHLPPMSAPKPVQYNSCPSPVSMTSSRNSMPTSSSSMYMNYSQSADRPLSSASYTANSNYPVRDDVRDDPRQYSYSQPAFSSSPHETALSNPSPTSPIPPMHTHHPHHHPQQQQHHHHQQQQQQQHQQPHTTHSQHPTHSQHSQHSPHLHHSIHRESTPSLPYPPRRSYTEPSGLQGVSPFAHIPTPLQSQHNVRLASPPRLQENRLLDTSMHMNGSQHSRLYDSQGRLHSLS
ncbi:hypothetical protein BDV98DRAFT_533795 [Pterulicium gracile]|uniref:BZIP domain-containing protein n=1 Tax=Pterulicium gracile TaxID=1884261 RepID=A0A5C3QE33_9AGAR|nr:hypothetical protein BDV98DRAFT_533795 [Pterula gracilis]